MCIYNCDFQKYPHIQDKYNMDFNKKKKQIKNDIIPFLVAIPVLLWINAKAGLGLPFLMTVSIPLIGYVVFVILELIGFYLWNV